MMSTCFAIILLSGCDQTNVEYTFPGSNDNPIGEPVAINISLQNFSEYNPTDKSTAATRNENPLISEYVELKTFSLTRSPEEVVNSKKIGSMELSADTVPPSPQTRSIMANGNQFRLIMFRKVGTTYVFQTAADYTSNGTSTPLCNQGAMVAPFGLTYRIIGYSFNNKSPLGTLSADYQWQISSISIPDLANDFLTFDSGDVTINNTQYSLPVTFRHKLCEMKVTISGRGSMDHTVSNCTGVYIKNAGNRSSWKIGKIDVESNTENPTPVDILSNPSSFTTRIVPYANSRPITVHFKTVNYSGIKLENYDVTSSQSVKLSAGTSYTLNISFSTSPVIIHLAASEIKLGGSLCTPTEKELLSSLDFAGSNLIGMDNSKPYEWGSTQSSKGLYYQYKSSWYSTVHSDGIDPCSKLDPLYYGTGWTTPSLEVLRSLYKCSDRTFHGSGFWFMNISSGVFLPAHGAYIPTSSSTPGYTEPTYWYGTRGGYRAIDIESVYYFPPGDTGDIMHFSSVGANIRCIRPHLP
ncbi:MAG: fimbrillin family protein [Bacteroides xylanisolvens]